MPMVSRLTDLSTTGHICTPITFIAVTTNTTVWANGLPVVRIFDLTAAHPFPPKPPCAPHVSWIKKGVNNVLTVVLPTAVIGKKCDNGKMKTGGPTVFAGGFDTGTVSSVAGGTPPGGQLSDVGAGSKYA
jgi:hypothetical protein